MANRRMFSKKITNSSEFLMMSPSAQTLYLHIGMNADDDGICELFPIMRMTDAKPDDIQLLHSKGFVYVIDTKVVIVRDWHENNFIRGDRYEPSRYLKDRNIKEIYDGIMPQRLGIPQVNQRYTEDRIGKDSKKEIAKAISSPVVEVRLDNEGKERGPRKQQDTRALSLRERCYTFLEKETGVRPTPNMGDYKQIQKALKTLKEADVMAMMEDAMAKGPVPTVRGALTDRLIDSYRLENV